jgi:hypothetical protein
VPSYRFFNIWDFLNDAPHRENGNFNPQAGVPTINKQDDRENLWGFFVQDDFKVAKNLTLNMVLRWSYFGALSGTQNNLLRGLPRFGFELPDGLHRSSRKVVDAAER